MTPPAPARPAPSWGDGSRRRGLVGALADSGAMLVAALRLLGRHWPAMLALFLAGMLARELVMRAAVQVSLFNAELAMLVLLLAPMTILVALVLMLRVARPSLALAAAPDSAPPSMLAHLGSVLIPFIGIYEWEGALTEDMREYHSRVFDDFFERTLLNVSESILTEQEYEAPVDVLDRVPLDLSVGLVAVGTVAFVGRWLLSRQAERHRWLGVPAAYLELVWLVVALLVLLGAVREWFADWAGSRQVVRGARSGWDDLIGPSLAWFTDQLGRADAVIALPVAWLAVGAVVLGHQATLVPETPPEAIAANQLYQQTRTRWGAVPDTIRWAGGKLTESLRDRFVPLWQGIRLLVRAGIAPMLLFCLVFVAVKTLAYWLWELQRLLIGPQDTDSVWYPLGWPLATLNRAVGYVVLVCVLAAAIDRVLRATAGAAGGQPTSNRT